MIAMLKDVMIKERDAITQMIEQQDEYDKILRLFERCQGKIVFMGVGKSGHIGKKLAVALTEGKSLKDSVRFANAMGALTVTKQGAIPSLHTRKEVEEFLAQKEGCR
jgi:D-arabinose 5-phosphate isomerase GutQ